jgi:hypothetical protein
MKGRQDLGAYPGVQRGWSSEKRAERKRLKLPRAQALSLFAICLQLL